MKLKKIIIGLFLVLAVFMTYIFVENQIVLVDNVSMKHPDLPKEFEGYKILQISDLHGRSFGKNQKRLIDKIDKLEYDLVLFTGDYIDENKQDLQPLEELLKGINDSIPKYFVLGNADEDLEVFSLVKGNKYFDLFDKYNVKSIATGAQIKKDNKSIWLTATEFMEYQKGKETIKEYYKSMKDEVVDNKDFDVNILNLEEKLEYEKYDFTQEYSKAENPFTINVEHRSIEIDYFQEHFETIETMSSQHDSTEWEMRNKIINWDMSISGHTHGGQVRLPFIGAVASPNSGLFPGEMNINGVHNYDGRVQYINPGLGASGPKLLRFRVFNPPKLGLIELNR